MPITSLARGSNGIEKEGFAAPKLRSEDRTEIYTFRCTARRSSTRRTTGDSSRKLRRQAFMLMMAEIIAAGTADPPSSPSFFTPRPDPADSESPGTLALCSIQNKCKKPYRGLVLVSRESAQGVLAKKHFGTQGGFTSFTARAGMENPMAASIGTLIGRFAVHLRPASCPESGRLSFLHELGGERTSLPTSCEGLIRRLPAPPVAIPRR